MKYSIGGDKMMDELIFWKLVWTIMDIGDKVPTDDPEFFLADIPMDAEGTTIKTACIRKASDSPSVKNTLIMVMLDIDNDDIHVRMPFLTHSVSEEPEMIISITDDARVCVKFKSLDTVPDEEQKAAYDFLLHKILDSVGDISEGKDLTVYDVEEDDE